MVRTGAVGARALAVAVWLLAACSDNPVQARAVWIDQLEQDDGTRRMHVYDRGELEELALLLPADVPQLRAQLGPDGRGLLIRGNQKLATYLDLEDARHLPLRLTDPPNNVPDPVQFVEAGDALHWREHDELVLVPLWPGAALERSEDGDWLEPLRVPLLGQGWVVSAANAPILFARDALSLQSSGAGYGQVVALRYAQSREDAVALAELARLDFGPPAVIRRQTECSEPLLCRSDWVVDPDGETVILDDPQSLSCRFRRWRWHTGSTAECLAFPEGLTTAAAALGLVAAIDDDVIVLRDHLRLHRVDLRSNEVESLPILGQAPYSWRTADAGRVLLWFSLEGPTLRFDAEGAHVVTTTQTACEPGLGSGRLQVSPDGRFAAWACHPIDDGMSDFEQSAVIRVSADGVERFEGIPMVVLAVDNRGDLLLYSTEKADEPGLDFYAPTRDPLSLWTLSADGFLRRADRLEPTPEPTLLLEQDRSAFIQAVALP